ncbi:MAG: hypothetical protein E6813_29950, partial [Bradyrhizobium sp.]
PRSSSSGSHVTADIAISAWDSGKLVATAGPLFVAAQTLRRRFGLGISTVRSRFMTEAQLGLVTATPIIIVFAVALRRIGVLSTTAAAFAVAASVAIAVVLFTTQ